MSGGDEGTDLSKEGVKDGRLMSRSRALLLGWILELVLPGKLTRRRAALHLGVGRATLG